jgi:hypothetical protein
MSFVVNATNVTAMTNNWVMLSIEVNRQLSSLVSQIHALLGCVTADATDAEVTLRVNEIHRTLDDLQEITGLGPTGSFDSLARHLHWMVRFHRERKPNRFVSDINDIRDRDFPGVIAAVEVRARPLLDLGLVEAITAPWKAQHYDSAVRDAFIYLEDRLRETGDVDDAEGLSGDRLVTRLLNPSGVTSSAANNEGLVKNMTSGELEGVFNFAKGTFIFPKRHSSSGHSLLGHRRRGCNSHRQRLSPCARWIRERTP